MQPVTTPRPNHQKLRMTITQEQLNHRMSCQRAAAHRSATTTSFAMARSLHRKRRSFYICNRLSAAVLGTTAGLRGCPPVAGGSSELSSQRVGQLAEAADAPNFPRHAAAGAATAALDERFGEVAQRRQRGGAAVRRIAPDVVIHTARWGADSC